MNPAVVHVPMAKSVWVLTKLGTLHGDGGGGAEAGTYATDRDVSGPTQSPGAVVSPGSGSAKTTMSLVVPVGGVKAPVKSVASHAARSSTTVIPMTFGSV